MHTAHDITKSIAIFATVTLLINAIAPTLAQAAKHLQGDQVNADTLVHNAYAIVTYYENNKLKRERGRIKAIGDTSFTIQNSLLGKATIAYTKVLSMVMGKDVVRAEKQMNVLRREIKKIESETKAIQRFKTHNAKVRFKAPSLTKKRIVGEVVKMTQDTLLIRKGRTFLEVPMSSISNFEVSLGQRRNAGKGFLIGLGLIVALAATSVLEEEKEQVVVLPNEQGYAVPVWVLCIPISIVVFPTLIGVAIKSEKWVGVSPQRLNLSIAPTHEKGLRAALTVNF